MSFENTEQEKEPLSEQDYDDLREESNRLKQEAERLDNFLIVKNVVDESGGMLTEKLGIKEDGGIDTKNFERSDGSRLASTWIYNLERTGSDGPEIKREDIMHFFDELKELDSAWEVVYEIDPEGKWFKYSLERNP